MTAKFTASAPEIKENIISGYLGSRYGGTYFYIEVSSSYPLASNIVLEYAARGDYYIMVGDYVNGERQEYHDFDGLPQSVTLKAGETRWSFLYGPGVDSKGTIDNVNWYIDFTEFTDKSYNYKKGITNGMDRL